MELAISFELERFCDAHGIRAIELVTSGKRPEIVKTCTGRESFVAKHRMQSELQLNPNKATI